jgi:prefoldin subunit 5
VSVGFPFTDLTTEGKLNALYQLALTTQELTVALQDQIAALTAEVANVKAGLTTLTAAVDAEQVQVANAIGLLSQDNPDIGAAIAELQAAAATINTVKSDVESTIPDAPPA